MDDFTDDYESDDFSDDFDDDGDLFEDSEDYDDDDGGDDFDLKLEDATPIGGINVKKVVIFGIAMEWEDEEGLGGRKRRKDKKRERDGN